MLGPNGPSRHCTFSRVCCACTQNSEFGIIVLPLDFDMMRPRWRAAFLMLHARTLLWVCSSQRPSVNYVCKRGVQSRGQGRDAARKRAGAEFPESRRFRAFSKGLCLGVRANLGLAFALRRDGTAGGVCARGRRQDQNSRHLDTNKDYDTGVRSRAFATTSSKHGAWGQGLAVLAILRNAGAGTRGRYEITVTVASINVAKAVRTGH